MNELIHVEDSLIGQECVRSVNARDLHAFLEIGKDFSTWIKDRIDKYGFIEGEDYTVLNLPAGVVMASDSLEKEVLFDDQKTGGALQSTGYNSFGQQGRKEYAITLNMAKELAMVQNNEKGQEARRYFIECERLAKQAPIQAIENLSRMDILKMAVDSEEERLRLARQIKEDAPRVEFAKRVESAPDAISVAQAAKLLGTGQRRLFAHLRQIGWVTRRGEPYQDKIESGYMDVKIGGWNHPDQGLKQSITPLITGKGLSRLQRILSGHDSSMQPATIQ